jgi:hypothetical protein
MLEVYIEYDPLRISFESKDDILFSTILSLVSLS